MARPKAPHPKVRIHATIPQKLYGRIILHTADPTAERGFAHGAMSGLFEAALTEYLDRVEAERTSTAPATVPK